MKYAFLWTVFYPWVSVPSKVKASLTAFSTAGACRTPCSYLNFLVPSKLQVHAAVFSVVGALPALLPLLGFLKIYC